MTSLLKEARERSGLTIEDVAQQLKIRRQYLVALEEERLGEIPGEVYAQGYMRMYATYLGVNLDERRVFRAKNKTSGFWSPTQEKLTRFGAKKMVISLSIIGFLCIFCWRSLIDKIESEDGLSLMDRLEAYGADESERESLFVNHSLIDTALGKIPMEESK